ncbi:hypothetical protein KCU65_g2874, partial [Aureobasidium melanogenum]
MDFALQSFRSAIPFIGEADDIGSEIKSEVKNARFAERGAFAPLVSSIRTKLYSPLLAVGIEFADLPGYTDTNIHRRKTSMAYSVNCPKVILVSGLSRCLTTPELERSLIDHQAQGCRNCLLATPPKKDNEDDESIKLQAKSNVQTIERQIFEFRIAVRDRIITNHFTQKKYQNKHDSGKIRVITVANKCHEHYMNGSNKAVLSFDKIGIQELRAYMCETPSRNHIAQRIKAATEKARAVLQADLGGYAAGIL